MKTSTQSKTVAAQIKELEEELSDKESELTSIEYEIDDLETEIRDLKKEIDKLKGQAVLSKTRKEKSVKMFKTIIDRLMEIIDTADNLENAKRRLRWLADDVERMIVEVEAE